MKTVLIVRVQHQMKAQIDYYLLLHQWTSVPHCYNYKHFFNVLLCLCVFHQIKYEGADTDFSASPAFYKQISRVECEEQRVIGTQTPLQQLLEGLIADKELPAKDKRKRLKQVYLHTKDVIRARFNWICLIRF